MRSRNNVKPIYVSIGHKISLPTALNCVMGCLIKYRLPETTRLSDKLASEALEYKLDGTIDNS
jgi:deoxyribonuclease V